MTETGKTETLNSSVEESKNGTKTEDEDDINEMEHLRKLFIGGLAPQTTEEGLKSFYGNWGKVVDAVVMRDPATKRSRGFGFITYVKSSSVDEAQKNRPHVIDGKNVDSKRALPRPERETKDPNISVKKLFVGGLKDNHDEKSLEDYFSQFGRVVSVKLLTDRTTGKRRGFAFIEYDDYDSVDKAVLQKVHSVKYAIIDVKKSVYTQERKFYNNAYDRSNNADVSKLKTHIRPQKLGYDSQGAAAVQYAQPQYNYWGAPQYTTPPQYSSYTQPPMPAATSYSQNSWNAWNTGQQQTANNWYTHQWPQTSAKPAGPPAPSGPPSNWSVPRANVPPANVAAQPAGPPPPPGPQGPPANFGTGYQQNYGGGPAKQTPPHSQRVHPYGGPPQNSTYAAGHQSQPPPPPPPQQQAYNGYGQTNIQHGPMPTVQNVPIAAGPPINQAAQMANKFRR